MWRNSWETCFLPVCPNVLDQVSCDRITNTSYKKKNIIWLKKLGVGQEYFWGDRTPAWHMRGHWIFFEVLSGDHLHHMQTIPNALQATFILSVTQWGPAKWAFVVTSTSETYYINRYCMCLSFWFPSTAVRYSWYFTISGWVARKRESEPVVTRYPSPPPLAT